MNQPATTQPPGIGQGKWRKLFHYDPLQMLLTSDDAALQYYTRRDLCGDKLRPVQHLWELPEARKILKKQLPDGSWPRVGGKKHPAINYALIETWRNLRFLVEQYGFNRSHPCIQSAAKFIFSCQTAQGDFRGFLANQYATYYTGALMSLLIQAGYVDDPCIEKGFHWLLAMRQDDGGWTIPILTHKLDRATQYRLTSEYTEPLQPDRSRPFSHHWTGMVLRAFAVHPVYCLSEAAMTAACLLKSRFFQPDSYTSYQAASYWIRFDFPFWWNNLLTALDSISRIGLPASDPQVSNALKWFLDHQESNGLWRSDYSKPVERESNTTQGRKNRLWISLAICRIFKRFSTRGEMLLVNEDIDETTQ